MEINEQIGKESNLVPEEEIKNISEILSEIQSSQNSSKILQITNGYNASNNFSVNCGYIWILFRKIFKIIILIPFSWRRRVLKRNI